MAENKQYISQMQDNGSVMISEDVVYSIAAQAISEVEGVVTVTSKPGIDIAELISKKNWNKGMKVAIAENNEISIDCNIVINYGHSVVTVAAAVQEAVVSAVESMTAVKVVAVNVNVCGIVRQ